MKFRISLVLLLTLIVACQSDYTRLVESELAKGIRKDSVLLGISLGDARNVYYGKCFDLNSQQLITEGIGGAVRYIIRDTTAQETATPIELLFRPSFDQNDRISDINLEFAYEGWAPWNRELQSDSLESRLKRMLVKWYGGNGFVTAHVNDSTDIPVKLDGNRRILVYREDPQHVLVKVQDILHPRFRHSISK